MLNIIIATVILLVYTLGIIKIAGQVPPSLSDSVFVLNKNWRPIWTIVLISVCFLCVPTIIEKSSESTQFLAFLAIGGLAFVGVAPLVKYKDDPMQFKVHEWGAIVCAACSQLLLVFNCPWLLLVWIPYFAVLIWQYTKYKKWRTMIFWGEAVCFATTFAYCLI